MIRYPARFTTRSLFLVLTALGCLLLVPRRAMCQVELSRHYDQETQRSLMEAVVRVRVKIKKGIAQGSAVCIGQDQAGFCYLLTCAHVIRGGERFQFEVFPRAKYPLAVKHVPERIEQWSAPNADLALLKVPFVVPRSVRVCRANTGARKGDFALDVGCGVGAPPTCQVGKLDGLDARNDLVFARGGVGGRSGGLLYTRRGVIGIHARGGDDRCVAVHYRKIRTFIKGCGQQWLLPQ
jgi:Trypsin-like peptidase domain